MPGDPATLEALRAALARDLTGPGPGPGPGLGPGLGPAQARPAPLAFGLAALDAALPGGGLPRAALHEVAGAGPEVEHASAAVLFVAGVLGRLCAAMPGQVLWVLNRADVFAPALASAGLDPDRVIYAEVPRPADVLLALEDALHHRGLVGVVGELSGRLTLTASRRLHLAAGTAAMPCFVLRRSLRHDDPLLAEPTAAVSRWRLASLPSPPPFPDLPEVGLARARWRLDLLRCRGGAPGSWIVEASDAQGRLGFPDEFRDRPAAAAGPAGDGAARYGSR